MVRVVGKEGALGGGGGEGYLKSKRIENGHATLFATSTGEDGQEAVR